MEDYINIARRIFGSTRYDASDEDVKRGSSSSCILVHDVFLPVREIPALTPNMQHYNWHSAVEKEGNSSVNPDAEKTLVLSALLFSWAFVEYGRVDFIVAMV